MNADREQETRLERRTGRGTGRDSIDHPKGDHDDLVNAAAGVLVLVAQKPPMIIHPSFIARTAMLGRQGYSADPFNIRGAGLDLMHLQNRALLRDAP
jgi:hypothetical protein